MTKKTKVVMLLRAYLYRKHSIFNFHCDKSNKKSIFWLYNKKEIKMSVARINMVDWQSKELFVEKTKNAA